MRPAVARSDPIIPDNPNWYRHKNACPLYRERWCVGEESDGRGGVLLYQIICLQNTPPQTEQEQALCMTPRRRCWRAKEEASAGKRRVAAAAV